MPLMLSDALMSKITLYHQIKLTMTMMPHRPSSSPNRTHQLALALDKSLDRLKNRIVTVNALVEQRFKAQSTTAIPIIEAQLSLILIMQQHIVDCSMAERSIAEKFILIATGHSLLSIITAPQQHEDILSGIRQVFADYAEMTRGLGLDYNTFTPAGEICIDLACVFFNPDDDANFSPFDELYHSILSQRTLPWHDPVKFQPASLPASQTAFFRGENNAFHLYSAVASRIFNNLEQHQVHWHDIWQGSDPKDNKPIEYCDPTTAQISLLPGIPDSLSLTDIKIVCQRHPLFQKLWQHTLALPKFYEENNIILAKLTTLQRGLERGDKYHSGKEYEAGTDAMTAQVEFASWWHTLPVSIRDKILAVDNLRWSLDKIIIGSKRHSLSIKSALEGLQKALLKMKDSERDKMIEYYPDLNLIFKLVLLDLKPLSQNEIESLSEKCKNFPLLIKFARLNYDTIRTLPPGELGELYQLNKKAKIILSHLTTYSKQQWLSDHADYSDYQTTAMISAIYQNNAFTKKFFGLLLVLSSNHFSSVFFYSCVNQNHIKPYLERLISQHYPDPRRETYYCVNLISKDLHTALTKPQVIEALQTISKILSNANTHLTHSAYRNNSVVPQPVLQKWQRELSQRLDTTTKDSTYQDIILDPTLTECLNVNRHWQTVFDEYDSHNLLDLGTLIAYRRNYELTNKIISQRDFIDIAKEIVTISNLEQLVLLYLYLQQALSLKENSPYQKQLDFILIAQIKFTANLDENIASRAKLTRLCPLLDPESHALTSQLETHEKYSHHSDGDSKSDSSENILFGLLQSAAEKNQDLFFRSAHRIYHHATLAEVEVGQLLDIAWEHGAYAIIDFLESTYSEHTANYLQSAHNKLTLTALRKNNPTWIKRLLSTANYPLSKNDIVHIYQQAIANNQLDIIATLFNKHFLNSVDYALLIRSTFHDACLGSNINLLRIIDAHAHSILGEETILHSSLIDENGKRCSPSVNLIRYAFYFNDSDLITFFASSYPQILNQDTLFTYANIDDREQINAVLTNLQTVSIDLIKKLLSPQKNYPFRVLINSISSNPHLNKTLLLQEIYDSTSDHLIEIDFNLAMKHQIKIKTERIDTYIESMSKNPKNQHSHAVRYILEHQPHLMLLTTYRHLILEHVYFNESPQLFFATLCNTLNLYPDSNDKNKVIHDLCNYIANSRHRFHQKALFHSFVILVATVTAFTLGSNVIGFALLGVTAIIGSLALYSKYHHYARYGSVLQNCSLFMPTASSRKSSPAPALPELRTPALFG